MVFLSGYPFLPKTATVFGSAECGDWVIHGTELIPRELYCTLAFILFMFCFVLF